MVLLPFLPSPWSPCEWNWSTALRGRKWRHANPSSSSVLKSPFFFVFLTAVHFYYQPAGASIGAITSKTSQPAVVLLLLLAQSTLFSCPFPFLFFFFLFLSVRAIPISMATGLRAAGSGFWQKFDRLKLTRREAWVAGSLAVRVAPVVFLGSRVSQTT